MYRQAIKTKIARMTKKKFLMLSGIRLLWVDALCAHKTTGGQNVYSLSSKTLFIHSRWIVAIALVITVPHLHLGIEKQSSNSTRKIKQTLLSLEVSRQIQENTHFKIFSNFFLWFKVRCNHVIFWGGFLLKCKSSWISLLLFLKIQKFCIFYITHITSPLSYV